MLADIPNHHLEMPLRSLRGSGNKAMSQLSDLGGEAVDLYAEFAKNSAQMQSHSTSSVSTFNGPERDEVDPVVAPNEGDRSFPV